MGTSQNVVIFGAIEWSTIESETDKQNTDWKKKKPAWETLDIGKSFVMQFRRQTILSVLNSNGKTEAINVRLSSHWKTISV